MKIKLLLIFSLCIFSPIATAQDNFSAEVRKVNFHFYKTVNLRYGQPAHLIEVHWCNGQRPSRAQATVIWNTVNHRRRVVFFDNNGNEIGNCRIKKLYKEIK